MDAIAPFDGLNTLLPSSLNPPNTASVLKNMRSEKGVLTKRAGFAQAGTTLTGTPMALIRFITAAGVEFTVCITTSKMYKWNTGSAAWDDITRIKSRVTCTTVLVTGTFTNGETVTQAVSGATGKFIAYDSVQTSIYLEYVSGTFNSVNTLTGSTSGATATINNTTTEVTLGAVDTWTGNETNIVNWCIATGIDGLGNAVTWLVVTNGLDMVRYWDGVGSKFKNINDAYGFLYRSFASCIAVQTFYSHLIFIAPYVLGIKPYTVAWSNTNSFVDWGFGSSGAGASGEAILTDIRGPLLRGEVLGDRLMLYSEDSITAMTHIGLPSVFAFDTLVTDTRLASSRSIVNLGPYHLFLNHENLCIYDGGRMIQEVGNKISRIYKSQIEANIANKHQAYGFFDPRRRRIYFAIPGGSPTQITFVCEFDNFDPTNLRWSTQEINPSRATCMGLITVSASTALLTVYGLSNGKIMQCLDTDIAYYQFDDQAGANTPIAADFQTIDFSAPIEYTSSMVYWQEVEFEARMTIGSPRQVTLSYSTDEGVSFQGSSVITITGVYAKYRYFINVTSRLLRLSFVPGDGKVEIRWARIWRKSAGIL